MKVLIKPIYFLAFLLLSGVALASDNADFNAWKQTLYRQAIAEGVSESTARKYIPSLKLLPSVVASDRKQPEFVSTFWDYVDTRLSEQRIAKGKMMMKRYPTWLKRLEERFGVPGQYLIAFWGLETNYGDTMGNTKTLDALATLAYDLRRRKFFTKELIAFLKILETEKFGTVYGSWAGAFGHFQFMPTTFLAYAVDADGNGTRNTIGNMPDAFASAANYLSKMGWNRYETWGREVVLPQWLDWNAVCQTKTVATWANEGVRLANGAGWPNEEMGIEADLILPMGVSGPAFLVYPNFKRIMRWNKSELYALTVAFLADILSDNWQGIYAERDASKLRHDDVMLMQTKLAELGYYMGTIDGHLGPKTRQAILNYQRQNALPQDGYPSKQMIMLLTQ